MPSIKMIYLVSVISFTLPGCVASTTAPKAPQTAFMGKLKNLCGKAFSGRLVTNESPDAAMVGMPMVMHVRSCDANAVRIPFHTMRADGQWDRSRTWVITRTATGLKLKHDHRHEDGTPDAVTMYGGDTVDAGSSSRQAFVVDDESIALFGTNNLPKSITNIWVIELDAQRFAYELRRIGENPRHFRVEFDLTTPVKTPPKPWG